MHTRRSLPALFAAAAVVSFAACGDDDDEPTATELAPATVAAAATEPMPVATGPVMSMPEGSLPVDEVPGLRLAAEELLVGQTESAAEQAATAEGWGFRVVRRNGEDLPMTMDYRPDRVNVAVEDGVVTELVSIG